MVEIIGFFLVGLTGGFSHCVLMCHPFVLYISSKYADSATGIRLILPNIYYNFGRILTYSLLGAVTGFLGGIVQYAGNFVNIQKISSTIGGLFLVLYAFSVLLSLKFLNIKSSKFTEFFKKLNPTNSFFTGILLGFLPCGLSMGAVIGSASSGSALRGALQLAAFGFGSAIALLVVAIFGSIAMAYSSKFKVLNSILILFMGLYFIYSGLKYSL